MNSNFVPLNIGLTKWTSAMMWVNVGLQTLISITAVNYQGSLDGPLSNAVDAENLYLSVSGFSLLVWVPTFVLLVVWIAKSHTSTSSLLWADDYRKYSRGWSIGVWFIPFANFFSTPQVFIENERIATGRRVSGKVDKGWRVQPRDQHIVWWFVLFSVGMLISRGGASAANSATDIDSYRTGLILVAIGALSSAAGIAIGAIHIRRVGEKLATNPIDDSPATQTARSSTTVDQLPPPTFTPPQTESNVSPAERPKIPVDESLLSGNNQRPSIPVIKPITSTEPKEQK